MQIQTSARPHVLIQVHLDSLNPERLPNIAHREKGPGADSIPPQAGEMKQESDCDHHSTVISLPSPEHCATTSSCRDKALTDHKRCDFTISMCSAAHCPPGRTVCEELILSRDSGTYTLLWNVHIALSASDLNEAPPL